MLERLTLGALLALGLLTLAVGTRWGPLMDLDHQVARAAFDATSGHAGRIDVWQAVSAYGGPHVLRIAMLVAASLLVVTRRFAAGVWLAALSFLEAEVAPPERTDRRPRHRGHSVVAVAASRMFLGVHYLSDVAGGVALGTALTAASAWLLLRIRPDALGRR